MNGIQITEDIARADFERFAKNARLKLDRRRNESGRRELEDDIQFFIEEVMDGRIQVDDEGWCTVFTESETLPEVRFNARPTATGLRAMDKVKSSNENGKMLAMIGDTLRIAPAALNSLEYVDLENVMLVFSFFLANRS